MLAICYHIDRGHIVVIWLLLQRGADVEIREQVAGMTVLDMAEFTRPLSVS